MEKGVTTAAGQGLNDKCEVGLYNCENVSLLLYQIRMYETYLSCHRTFNYET